MSYYKGKRDKDKTKLSRFIIKNAKILKLIINKGSCCSECGISDLKRPWIYQFHHTNKSEKEKGIGSISSLSYELMKKEADKCVCVCENCHRKIHSLENFKQKSIDRKIKFLEYKKQLCCSRCGYDEDIKCLDFHHIRDKKYVIADIVSSIISVTEEEINNELDKCIVLCANCHREEHANVELFLNNYDEIINKVENLENNYKVVIDQDEVIRLNSLGLTQVEISEILKCGKSTVCEILKKNNIHVRHQEGIHRIDESLVTKLIYDNMNDSEINRTTGYSREVIAKIRKNNTNNHRKNYKIIDKM